MSPFSSGQARLRIQRIHQQELLDLDSASAPDVASALRSLRWVNYFFGGNRLHKKMLRQVIAHAPNQSSTFEILEVASGHATVLQSAARKFARENISLRITLLDRSADHLPAPSDWHSSLPAPTLIHGDALHIPLPDASVDVVSCCLFLHHLDEPSAQAFLQEALRVARVAVIINDLERRRRHYLLVRLFSLLIDPSRLSQHDGPASVHNAYTLDELRGLLEATGCRFTLQRAYLYRMAAVLWK